MRRICVAVAFVVAGWTDLNAADSTLPTDEEGIRFFETKIRPVLVKRCYECHSQSTSTEGSLRVDSRASLLAGGDRGPAVVPYKPEESWLWIAAAHKDPDLQMPPKPPRLSDAELEDLRRWIEMGAPDPRTEDIPQPTAAVTRDIGSHWAYLPVQRPPIPAVNGEWPRTAIDVFVLAKLEESSLSPSPDAAPEVLLRRLYFDLVGLPPSPEDLQRFLAKLENDSLDTALEAEVDQLLASPRFGERWGRHWLDVARFGESSGKEANISFPYAWRYRDYVIDCVNADMPVDRFITEQIAGDLIAYGQAGDSNGTREAVQGEEEIARLLIATGFLAIGPKNLDEMSEKQFQADVIDEQIDTVSRAILGNSIACARCHDHKSDPFSMTDYYALAGIFASTKTYFGTAVSPANRIGGDPLVLPKGAGQPILHASIPAKEVKKLKEELAALQQEQREKMASVQKAIAEGKDPGDLFTLRDALRIFWRSGAIEGELERVDDQGNALPLAMGVLEAEQVRDTHFLHRGEVNKPGDTVPRGFPKALNIPTESIPEGQSGRWQLARWLTDERNPLTARVFVNRVWHHLFGIGLVRTVDNFGTTGEPPSHPELLDHLALDFMHYGWSLKRLVRDIVLSRSYRQASTYRPDAFNTDPENRLLWRMSKRRLEAEAIRDAMLAISGELDLARPTGSLVGRVIGDRPISLIGLDKRLPKDLDGSRHRSVYLPVIRDRLPEVLELFDFAEPSMVTGTRETTNVPVQALYLMNGPFVMERSQAFAARLRTAASSTDDQLRLAFLLCFCREPTPGDREACTLFLHTNDADDVLASLCQALLSTPEFRNLD